MKKSELKVVLIEKIDKLEREINSLSSGIDNPQILEIVIFKNGQLAGLKAVYAAFFKGNKIPLSFI